MPPVSVLIKPASSACNMECGYCFYRDEAERREENFCGVLSDYLTESIIKKAMDFAEGSCSFMFQGGEPTLAGLDYFKRVVELQKKHKKPGVKIHNAIQTNGFAVDDEWAAFFAQNGFLVGLSLDGPAGLHNAQRPGKGGAATFNRVMAAARVLEKAGAEFNILCVVTAKTSSCPQKVYNFYKKNGFRYLQFIPCLDPLAEPRGQKSHSLTPAAYGDFLIKLFNLWLADFKKGEYVSIRNFDNYISMILGQCPEACGMSGKCSIQFVCEGNGNVYPCDFYALDEWLLGNIGEKSFAEMAYSETAKRFLTASVQVPEECKACRFFGLCRNGCRRDRVDNINYYCESYKAFFSACLPGLYEAARTAARFG